ncbi:FKBP-type peptidyl-prolyl cis-trans isomerase [Lysobacter silvisoli]|uniref:Peptidyl-prolyl cis-trans isomerase n=1 Tax=Lysobacter silvisoli TaxID=2293254 RepID=A0A371K3B6_9GAMM|nr:FKBP-type peptidyl-prolyl cis-trans isomerase [Lysobacter silvisoli]RDZ28403.1 FKBP-type peptidyl-prolyl cis-trans isomerase [Lysobacter silvisoli]
MKPYLRHSALALALGSVVLFAAGCDKKPGEGDAAKPAAEAGKEAGKADVKAIPGLATEKEQVSYMIGMDIAKSLEMAKDEIDLETINKAMKTVLAGEKPLMDEKQAGEVRDAFAQKIQAKQIAKMMAEAKKNLTDGEAFLAANGKKAGVVTTASGLQYQVLTEGKGPKPKPTDMVRVHYKGTLIDGKQFDSSYERNQPVEFPLPQVVPGWQEGIALMPVGSKFKLWIPSKLGYGEKPTGPIPPNSVLVFDVELLDIVGGKK